MAVVMRIIGSVEGVFEEAVYLKSYDPDANDGHGDIEGTTERAEALRFPTSAEFLEEWRRVSTVRPLRPDGKPNRPLSAYTVMAEPE